MKGSLLAILTLTFTAVPVPTLFTVTFALTVSQLSGKASLSPPDGLPSKAALHTVHKKRL